MDAPKTAEMPFIFTDGRGKSEKSKRKLIRQHVMLGKNKGKTRRPVRTAEQHTDRSDESNVNPSEDVRLLMRLRYPSIPNRVGSELSFTQFASPVEPSLIQDLLKLSLMAKRIMYPLEKYFMFHKTTKIDTSWFELLTSDAAYLHAAVFSTQTYISHTSLQNNPKSRMQIMLHQSSALRLLQERLSGSQDNCVSDATIIAVLYMALHAHFVVDYTTASHHMQGLCKIVDIRGGLSALKHNTKLVMELLKCDLGIALNNGTEPFFLYDTSQFIAPAAPHDSLTAKTNVPRWLDRYNVNNDLSQVWVSLKKFCDRVNTAAEKKLHLPKETLLDGMASTMYRLLGMKDFEKTSTNEALRLGLLVFSSHIFLDWQGIKPPQAHLPDTYRDCLLHLSRPGELPPQMLLWLLMVGSLAIFTPADHSWLLPWIRANIEMCGADSWEDVQEHLKDFPWIGGLLDEPGRRMYDAAKVKSLVVALRG